MRRKFLQLILICLMALSVLGQQQPGGARDDAATPERLRAHISYLASDKLEGRRTGTQGAEMAAAYIAAEFARDGLVPGFAYQSERHRNTSALDHKYLQPFPFVAGVELGKGNQMLFTPGANIASGSAAGEAHASALEKNAASLDLRPGEDWMPLGFSPSASVSNVPVTFVGYGITANDLKYDDYAGADAAGRLAIAFAGTPDGDNPHGEFAHYEDVRWKTIAARDHGAKALVIIAREENFRDDRLSRLSYDNSSGDAGLPVVAISRQAAQRMLNAGGLAPLEELEKALHERRSQSLPATGGAVASSLVQKSMSAPLRQVALSIKTDIVRLERPSANVIGILEGTDPKLKAEAIIIGAHYDHLGHGGEGSLAPRAGEVHHGADDNASGVAGVLELARMFSKKGARLGSGASARPRRTLIFIAFSGEEEGLLGSNFYVNHPVWPLAQTVAMINMDMIGRMKEQNLIVGGVGTAQEWRSWVNEDNHRSAVSDKSSGNYAAPVPDSKAVARVVPGTTEMLSSDVFKLTLNEDGYGPSDHSSFYAKQVPVLFFWTGTHADYHKPSDTADKINYEDEAHILRFVAAILHSIDASDRRPTYTVAKSESAGRSTGFRVYLGTIPNYAETGEGLKLDGVRDDSPAAAAGLKAGDLVVRLAGRDIRNVYDYTYALGEMKAGQEYEVEVVRGTEHLKLKIIPKARK
jgi:aminopeptidase YwaD